MTELRKLADPIRPLPVYALEKARETLLCDWPRADQIKAALAAIDEALRVLAKGESK